jgi:hypothetical protein
MFFNEEEKTAVKRYEKVETKLMLTVPVQVGQRRLHR